MKQFEKWETNDACDVPSDVDCCYMECHDACKKIKATAWRAALRWAKAMHDVSSEPRFAVNIKNELEGGD